VAHASRGQMLRPGVTSTWSTEGEGLRQRTFAKAIAPAAAASV
jgi:hypothetical protein